MRCRAMGLEEVGRQHRRDHARDCQRHQHGDHDSEAEVLEELARDARHRADGEKHRDDTEAGGDHRQTDLVRCVDRCLIGCLAHAHVAHDVLDLDDRVIDQHAGDQRQGKQRELVEIEAEQIHEPEGRDGRQGDGHSRDRGCPPVAQEEEHDHHCQDRTLDHRGHGAFVLLFGIFDRVEQRDELHPGILRLDLGDFFERLVIDRHVGCALRAAHREVDDLLVAHLADRCALGIAVAYGGHIGQLDRAAATDLDLPLAERIGIVTIAQHAHRLPRPADFGHATGRIDIALPQHAVDLAGGDAQRLHPREVEDHLDLAIDAAETIDLGHAFDAEQLLGDRIVDEPAEALDRHVVGFDRIDGEETARDLFLGHTRLEDTVGQRSAHRVDRILHLGHRIVGIGTDLEFDESVRIAFARSRIDRLHAIDRTHGAFDPLRDLVLDLGRSGARLRDRDIDRRELDVRIVDHVHAGEADQARQQQGGERNQRDHRVADRPGRDIPEVHCLSPAQSSSANFVRTVSPSVRKPPARSTTRSEPVSPSAITMPFDVTVPVVTARRSALSSPLTMRT